MDAVNPCTKFWPPIGPISPAAKNPPTGTGPSAPSSIAASWSATSNRRVPRPLQVNSSAACARRPREEELELVVGGLGVAPVEPDGAAERHPVVDGQRAGGPVGPDHVAQEVVARAGLHDVLVDQAPDQQPVGLDAGHLGRSEPVLDLLHQAVHGRGAGHLVDHVPVRPGHGERVAEAPAALGDHELDVDPGSDEHADGTRGEHPVPEDQAGASRTAASRQVPAD